MALFPSTLLVSGTWRRTFDLGTASGSSRVKDQTPRERLPKLLGLLTYKVWLETSGLPISCLQNGNGSRTGAAVRIKSVNMCVALRTALHKVNNIQVFRTPATLLWPSALVESGAAQMFNIHSRSSLNSSHGLSTLTFPKQSDFTMEIPSPILCRGYYQWGHCH